MKVFYRKSVLRKFLISLEREEEAIINIKMACDMLSTAWKDVSNETIQNCWTHAGFTTARVQSEDESVTRTEGIGNGGDDNETWNYLQQEHVISS